MNGMEMMLKSMGIQTEEIKQLLNPENVKRLLNKIEKLCNDVDEMHERLSRIVDKNALIYESLRNIEIKLGTIPETVAMDLLADGESQAFKDAAEYVRDYNGGNSGNGNDRNDA